MEDVHGPIDYVLLEFSDKNLNGDAATELLNLVELGIIRVYDLLIVRKDEDGTFSGLNIEDLSADELGSFTAFAGASTGLLGDEDAEQAASAMEPGTVAVLIVYENSWAVPFVAAARRNGAQLIASERIPAQAIIDALDEVSVEA